MSHTPLAFMSYVRDDDAHENGRLSQFCARLSGEIKMQGGEAFPIFQDRNDIEWGQQWEQRIEDSLDAATFLIPILTPSFFKSRWCRRELERFLEREAKLGRGDLILPLYYVDCPLLNDEAKRASDPLAGVIAGRNFTDWRELRFEPLTAPHVSKTLADMARQVIAAMERGHSKPPTPSQKHQPDTAHNASTTAALAERSENTALRGPHPKYEPPTRVVDAMHRGDHATLTEALQTAQPGDRILVRPGLYREAVIIDKPVEIIGDGDVGEVVIESMEKDEDTITFQANMGRIVSLTLRQTGGGNGCCIYTTQGRLEVENCDITSSGIAGVGIVGSADPRLRRNRIHDCDDCGVVVIDTGQGTFEDNDITANAESGVLVGGCGHPTLRRNRIGENGGIAIAIAEGSYGIFEDNDLRGNKDGAWDIDPACLNKVIRRNNQEDE